MPTITAEGDKTFEAPADKKLVLAIEDAGIDILHRCGGNARCTTCRIELLTGDAGEMGEAEKGRLAREVDLPENVRLSCQIRCQNDLTVRVINHLHLTDLSDPGPRPVD
jgi:ferredoxin